MKVTIITVTYNSAKFLEQSLQSVISQHYSDIEHIIIDGGSTDGTLDIIKKYQPHIARWISEKDSGMYDAINKGMRMATGDIIGTLNSDDMLASRDVVTAIVNNFTRYNAEAVYGDIVYVQQDNTQKVLRTWNGDEYSREKIKYGWMPAHPSFYIRKKIIERCGFYETHFYTAADYEFMIRYLYFHSVNACYLPKLIVRMRSGGMSNGSISRRLRANRRDYLAMKKNKVPFAMFISILKPLRKIHQFKNIFTNSFAYLFKETLAPDFINAEQKVVV